jgi:DNA (cytosine-5)-methyltransferase 1
MNYLSVCSGVEAATVAWHEMGWNPVAFSEIEPFPSAVLAHHYPNVPNLGDMTKYKEWNLNESIDILVGGTPCQSFSVAGLRKGLEDPRGNLALTYIGILDKFKPKWCIWENVQGVLSSNGGRDFGSFLGALAELGYGYAFRTLDAQYFGVPQRRRRVFVVGCLGDAVSASKALFESEGMFGNPPKSRRKGQGTASYAQTCTPDGSDTIGTLMARDYKGIGNQDLKDGRGLVLEPKVYENHANDSRVKEMGDVCSTVTSRWGTGGGNVPFVQESYALQGAGATSQNANGMGYSKDICYTLNVTDVHGVAYGFEPGIAKREGEPNRFVEEMSPTLRANMGDNQTAVAQTLYEWHNQDSRVKPIDVAATLSCNAGGREGHLVGKEMTVRRLTPIECERLQGFPDDYTNIPWRKKLESPDGPRYKAMGNSMAVPVMKWIGKKIGEMHG